METITEKLMSRFLSAKEKLGPDWRTETANADKFFDTRQGLQWMNQAASQATKPNRISTDRLDRVVQGMEKALESLQEAR